MKRLTAQNINDAMTELRATSDIYDIQMFAMYCDYCKFPHYFTSESPEKCKNAIIKTLNDHDTKISHS